MDPILVYIIVINSLSFLTFGIDKALAVAHKKRVSEMTLLLLTLLGGTVGASLAMPAFKHKVSKSAFLWKFFAVVVLQVFLTIWFLNTTLYHFKY